MMDFPSSPVLNQEFTSGSTTYVWNGQGWLVKPGDSVNAYTKVESDAKFVELAGDTMTGSLKINGPNDLVVAHGGVGVVSSNVKGVALGLDASIFESDGVAANTVITVNRHGGNGAAILFQQGSPSGVGSITVANANSTQFNTTSDARLKEDLKTFDAGHIIDQTEVYDFKWKNTQERSYGVMAQQAAKIYPTPVTYDEATDWWGVDYSKYVPVLLQELKALRSRVTALEKQLAVKPSVRR